MNLDEKRKQLAYRAWHRGTKEMDILLGTFADRYIQAMDEQELSRFDKLLTHSDPELYDWYLQKEAIPQHFSTDLMQRFLKHKVA